MPRQSERFIWFDLQTTDADEALDFYPNVVPVERTTREDGGRSYDMWRVGEDLFGGLVEMPADATGPSLEPHWLGYVGVADLDRKLARLDRLGGKQVGDTVEIGDACRYAIVRDPQGAVFALRESRGVARHRNHRRPERPGVVSWYELTTTDVDAAWTFYSRLLEWRAGPRTDVGVGLPYQRFGWRGRDRGSMLGDLPDSEIAPSWLYHFAVEDLEAALDRLERRDGSVAAGPMKMPDGSRVAHCRDPQGAMFALHLPAAWRDDRQRSHMVIDGSRETESYTERYRRDP